MDIQDSHITGTMPNIFWGQTNPWLLEQLFPWIFGTENHSTYIILMQKHFVNTNTEIQIICMKMDI